MKYSRCVCVCMCVLRLYRKIYTAIGNQMKKKKSSWITTDAYIREIEYTIPVTSTFLIEKTKKKQKQKIKVKTTKTLSFK